MKNEKQMIYMSPTANIFPEVLEKEKSIFGTENLEENTGFLMLQVSNLWKNQHGKTLKKHHGLSPMQYAVLTSIYRFSLHGTKEVTQIMLGKYLKIEPMTLSYVFKGLEAKDYIHRINHPTDVKIKIIDLTQKGKELIDQTVNIIEEADYKFFKGLNENTDYFNKHLKKLLKANK